MRVPPSAPNFSYAQAIRPKNEIINSVLTIKNTLTTINPSPIKNRTIIVDGEGFEPSTSSV